MYEDENDGFGYQDGNYLMTYYEAEQVPIGNGSQAGGEVLVRVARTEGSRQRPRRTLCVRLLLGHSTQVLHSIHLHEFHLNSEFQSISTISYYGVASSTNVFVDGLFSAG